MGFLLLDIAPFIFNHEQFLPRLVRLVRPVRQSRQHYPNSTDAIRVIIAQCPFQPLPGSPADHDRRRRLRLPACRHWSLPDAFRTHCGLHTDGHRTSVTASFGHQGHHFPTLRVRKKIIKKRGDIYTCNKEFPDSVRCVRQIDEPDGLSIAKLTEQPIPEDWNEQRRLYGFPER